MTTENPNGQISPFKQRLLELIELEKVRRGRFPKADFAHSVGLQPQSISSMRNAISMDSLAKAMELYPHWNFCYLVAGIGEPLIEEKNEALRVASGPELTAHVLSLLDSGQLFTLAYVRTIERERDEFRKKVAYLEERVKQLEHE